MSWLVRLGLFPPQASEQARAVDLLFFALTALSALITLGIAVAILVFGVRYRRGSNAYRGGAHTSNAVEVTWIVIPVFISLGLFAWGAVPYFSINIPPKDALTINVIGKQWMWKFQHPDGTREINDLHLPKGRAIALVMTSQDVIHSFFVPEFRVKKDVLPGRYTTVWFRPTVTGTYHVYCSQYCGTDHALMRGRAIVMEPADYAQWLAGAKGAPGAEAAVPPATSGRELFVKHRCAFCHLEDGKGVGPSLRGVAGKTVKLQSGQSVVADDDYLRDSIVYPNSQVVDGYPNVMPTFRGQLDDRELRELIDYVRSLGPRPPGVPDAPPARPAAVTLPEPRR